MRRREFHPFELAWPGVFLIAAYVAIFTGYSPINGPTLSPRYILDRAKVLTRRGHFAQALIYTQKLTGEFPTNHVYWAQEADLQRRLGNYEGEARALEKIMIYSSVPDEACPRLGQAYEELGDHAKMLDAFGRCLHIEPNNADAHFFLGHAKERVGDLDGALGEFQACLNRAPHYLDCSLGQARVFLRRGDPMGASRLLGELQNTDLESNSDALYVRAVVRRRLGLREQALEDLNKAVEISPSYGDIRREIASLKKEMSQK